MKLISEVGSDKLRGGFYTPDFVVDYCLQRLKSLMGATKISTLLEPAAGDGAFVRGLARTSGVLQERSSVVCAEIIPDEAAICRSELARAGLKGEVFAGSFFEWAHGTSDLFDAVVGNPPFVRYQFVSQQDRSLAESLLCRSDNYLQGVSNLWIPFVWVSLSRLRQGGAFSLVLPSEIFGTVSAGQIREHLVKHFSSLRVDLFPRSAFPQILQDVVVVSGKRSRDTAQSRSVRFEAHASKAKSWHHSVPATDEPWTRFLLQPKQLEALAQAADILDFQRLGDIAQIGVAIVTGANDFFTVEKKILDSWDLHNWAVPLLARTAESPGLIFSRADHAAAARSGKKAWLLAFTDERPDPTSFVGPKKYLSQGEVLELHLRFKCRIRSPWYAVPNIASGELMMAKRSHLHHRLILNRAKVVTTDTIYRGNMKPPFGGRARDLVASFHNSLTLLSAEIEGRTYGGGVLELVPSEISRLVVPLLSTNGAISDLDKISRAVGGQRDPTDALVQATDEMLCKQISGYEEFLQDVFEARMELRKRRFQGNGGLD